MNIAGTSAELIASALRVVQPAYGPLVIQHARVNLFYPTSILDAISMHGNGLISGRDDMNVRVVPCDGIFKTALERLETGRYDEFEVRTIDWIHLTHRDKGRPSEFMRFNVETLRRWRREVTAGQMDCVELSRLAKCSKPAAGRFAHGKTLWWI